MIKTILLMTWKTPKRNLNPKTLGWVRPDGIINFQTAEAAENYAKNRCVFALHNDKPFERGVFVKNNEVLAEINGDFSQIDLSDYSGKVSGASFFHGHPVSEGEAELPLSLMDYLTMVSQKLRKIVAFNKNGEYSSLVQNPKKSLFIRLLPRKLQEKLEPVECIGLGSIATSEYAKEYSQIFPKELQKKIEQVIHTQIGIPYGSRKKISEFQNKKQKLTIDEFSKISQVEEQAKKDGTLAETINNFWKAISKKLDCTYETNYTNLT